MSRADIMSQLRKLHHLRHLRKLQVRQIITGSGLHCSALQQTRPHASVVYAVAVVSHVALELLEGPQLSCETNHTRLQ